MLHSGDWWPVCGYGWDLQDAHVVCRQLGYSGAESSFDSQVITTQPSWWEGVWLDNVQCVGNEKLILECRHNGLGFCLFGTSASLVCSPEGTFLLLHFTSDEIQKTIYLA